MAVFIYLLVIAAALLVGLYLKIFYRKTRPGEPPLAKGHFLWGNGEEFNSNAVSFLHRCKSKLGSIFTIRLLNQHLTIIMDPQSYEPFHKERNFDFDAIQKQVNQNVFSFAIKNPQRLIKDVGKVVRGESLMTGLQNFINNVHSATETNVATTEDWNEDGLRVFCARTLFDTLYKTLFGRSEANTLQMYHDFEVFHQYFNFLWLGLPVKMFPTAGKALERLIQQPSSGELASRDDLPDYLRKAIVMMQQDGQTESDIIGHNLVYLHVNYNTFRVGFWVLEYLLQNPEAYSALMEELNDVIEAKCCSPDDDVELTINEVENLPVLDSIVQETFRLSSGVFMVRYVTEDTWFSLSDGSQHLVRSGDRVAIYPPALHKNPAVFPNPHEFQHDRFINKTFVDERGQDIKHPIIGFGSLCPGKRLALSQLKWFVLYMLNRFDFEHLDGEKAELDYQYYGHEVIPPKKDVQMRYRQRSQWRNLCLT